VAEEEPRRGWGQGAEGRAGGEGEDDADAEAGAEARGGRRCRSGREGEGGQGRSTSWQTPKGRCGGCPRPPAWTWLVASTRPWCSQGQLGGHKLLCGS